MATGRATAGRQSAGKVPLLEREAELARIEEVLASSREGHGGVAMVGGPAGIGKTSLLAVARSAGEAAGTRVLRARGGELEHEFGFGVVRQLFEPLLAEAKPDERAEWLAGAAGLAARLLGLAGAGTTPDPAEGPPDPSFAVLHGLYWLCANVAADRPLCLIVDDAHWADTPSLRYLAFLLPRLEELSVALLIGLRPDEDERTAGLLSSLAADMATELVEPSPLSHAAVERLLREGLPDAPDAEFVAACQRATGGVPFLVEQLVRALREDGVSPTAAAAGGIEALGSRSIGRWVLLRLGRLPARAQQLARAMAILEAGDLPAAAQ
ncbi:MAG TPA: AAA family ATPase, partial [Thermoleophilaceae bacterium]|nr:AAA family ATPase [Thermoleophilaceae bacterium]